jgi:aldehyde dehydrogenase (NAD+)
LETMAARHTAAAHVLPRARLIIGGASLDEGSAGTVAHVDPSTGRPQAQVALAGPAEVNLAVGAAHTAFAGWRSAPVSFRRGLLLKLVEVIRADAERLATIAALENGVTRQGFLHGQLPLVYDWISYYAGWADKLSGGFVGGAGSGPFDFVIPEPYGVIAAILPWNAPLVSIAMKCIPALAAGNTVIAKPAELAPFLAVRFAELAREAGFPDGVINILTGGPQAGEALVQHPGINKISFTGSPATARRILAASAERITPTLFELGGKSASLVFPDTDLDKVAAYAATYPFSNAGQICASPSRLIVHEDVYRPLIEKMVAITDALAVGDPLVDGTFTGPMMTEAALQRVLDHIARASQRPEVNVVVGGRRGSGSLSSGFFMMPTIVADPDPDSALSQTELFGPVVVVHRFRDEAEAIRIANGTDYGLTAYIQTASLDRALRVARELEAGGVYINRTYPISNPHQSFGGVATSGYGREGGYAGIEEFVRLKGVSINVESS